MFSEFILAFNGPSSVGYVYQCVHVFVLQVQPFAGIIDSVRWTVPRVLFNREAVGPFRSNKRAQDVVAAGKECSFLYKVFPLADI